MHVCMLAGNPLLFDGRVLRHAETLAAAGHRVTLLGVVGPNDTAAAPPELAGVRIWRLQRRRTGGVAGLVWLASAARRHAARLLVEKLGPLPPFAELLVAPCAVELTVMAATVDADIYHANDLDTLVPAAWAARLRRRPYIYDAHELYADESPHLGPGERRARARVEAALFKGARANITVSDLLADELQRRYGGARPTVLRNLPPLVPRPARQQVVRFDAARPLRLLLHGAWVGLEQPGVDSALQAVAALPQVTLTLRGGVRDEAALRGRIEALGIAQRVRLASRLPGAEALVAAAIREEHDVGLSVHLPDCQSRVLATSSKVFEYLMAGLAIVATDLPGNRHILGELSGGAAVGLTFAPGDAEDLAAKLATLAADPSRLHAMQEAARQVAEQGLCWERERARLLALYQY